MKQNSSSRLVWILLSIASISLLIVFLYYSIPKNPTPLIVINRIGIFITFCSFGYSVYKSSSIICRLFIEPQSLEDGCTYIYRGKSQTGNLFLTEVVTLNINYDEHIIGGCMEYSTKESLEDGVYTVHEDILKQELILNQKYVYKNNVLVEINEQ